MAAAGAVIRNAVLAATLAAAATAGLTGCASRPVRPGPEQTEAARRATLEALPRWQARGRIALKTPETGGQGSFTWAQSGDAAVIRVAGPFGAGAYEVQWTPARLTVLSARGEVAADYAGPDAAERFLEAQLGWSLPVSSARHWLLGLAAAGSPAMTTTDGRGLLVDLEQDGWQVHYQEYQQQDGISLPRRLVLEHAGSRVRFVIDAWQF